MPTIHSSPTTVGHRQPGVQQRHGDGRGHLDAGLELGAGPIARVAVDHDGDVRPPVVDVVPHHHLAGRALDIQWTWRGSSPIDVRAHGVEGDVAGGRVVRRRALEILGEAGRRRLDQPPARVDPQRLRTAVGHLPGEHAGRVRPVDHRRADLERPASRGRQLVLDDVRLAAVQPGHVQLDPPRRPEASAFSGAVVCSTTRTARIGVCDVLRAVSRATQRSPTITRCGCNDRCRSRRERPTTKGIASTSATRQPAATTISSTQPSCQPTTQQASPTTATTRPNPVAGTSRRKRARPGTLTARSAPPPARSTVSTRPIDEVERRHAAELALRLQQQAMRQRRRGQRLDVVDGDERAALRRGQRPRTARIKASAPRVDAPRRSSVSDRVAAANDTA